MGLFQVRLARSFRNRIVELTEARALGIPPFSYLRFCHNRRRRDVSEQVIALNYRDHRLLFSITPAYGFVLKEIFIKDQYSLDGLFKNTPTHIIDLGANIGLSAAAIACQCPQAEFILVEPDPRNIKRLRQTVQWNKLRAKILPIAAAATAGRQNLLFSSNPVISHLETSSLLPPSSSNLEVETRTLSQIIADCAWPHIDLVKIDVEGSEEHILTVNNTWLDQVDVILVEIHPGCSRDKIAAALEHFGLHLQPRWPNNAHLFLATRVIQ